VHLCFTHLFAFALIFHSHCGWQALGLDSVVFSGQTLKLRRPKDYQPVPGSIESSSAASQTRLLVAGFPLYPTEDEVRTATSAQISYLFFYVCLPSCLHPAHEASFGYCCHSLAKLWSSCPCGTPRMASSR
jgi:hypothetical protein